MPIPISRRRFLHDLASATSSLSAGNALKAPGVSTAVAPPVKGDAGNYLQSIIDRLPKKKARLSLLSGIWRFSALRGIVLRFHHFDGLEVDGNSSTLIFDGIVTPFYFEGCSDIVFRDLSIRWDNPPFTEGTVTKVASGGREIFFNPEQTEPVAESSVYAISQYNRISERIYPGGFETYVRSQMLKNTGGWYFQLAINSSLLPGDYILARHVLDKHVIHFWKCSNVLVQSVSVYAGAGMAFVFDYCQNVTASSLTVEPSGSRTLSVNEDACHFNCCSGRLEVRDNLFRAMGDDGINMHSRYFRAKRTAYDDRLTVEVRDIASLGPLLTSPIGDEFLFVGTDWKVCGTGVVRDFAKADRQTQLTFAAPLPNSFPAVGFIANVAFSAKCDVLGNVVSGNRGRGIIAHRDASISYNQLFNQSQQAFLCGVDSNLEGLSPANIELSHNEFVAEDAPRKDALIDINDAFSSASNEGGSRPNANNIAIVGNCLASNSLHVNCRNVAHLAVDCNHCSGSAKAPHAVLRFRNCDYVSIEGNKGSDPLKGSISTGGCSNVTISRNLNLNIDK